MKPVMSQNFFLANLSRDCQEALDPHLEIIEIRKGQPDERSLWQSEAIYFPLTGLFSVEMRLADGFSAHLALLGFRNAICGKHLVDVALPGHARAVVGGYSLKIPKDRFLEAVATHADLQRRLQDQLIQITSLIGLVSACNLHHALSKRLARWLLFAADISATKSFDLTHEELAHLLGVRREAVTEAVARLSQSGAVETARGRLAVSDPGRLQSLACECHRNWASSQTPPQFGVSPVRSRSTSPRIGEPMAASGM